MSSQDEEMQDAPVNGHVEENGAEEEVEERQRIRVVRHDSTIAPGSGEANAPYSFLDPRTRLHPSNLRTRIILWETHCATSS